MGPYSTTWDHSYCWVPSQQVEFDNRLGVKKQFRLLRIEASSPVISENLSTEGKPRERSVCFQIISSDQDLLFLETKSLESSSRCLPTNWFHKSLYAFPAFCMIPNVLSKALKYEVPMMILVTPAWPLQLWYPEAKRMSNLTDLKERSLKNPKIKIIPLS